MCGGAELAGAKGPRWKEELRGVWEVDGRGDEVPCEQEAKGFQDDTWAQSLL